MTYGKYVVVAAAAVLVGLALWVYRTQMTSPSIRIDPRDKVQVLRGRAIYEERCAACHGHRLEGQPDWRVRRADGRLPAPPHDETGHTWHHPDAVLFAIVKNGLVPPYAPSGYASDMPAFASVLSDDDIAVTLAYIESRWPREVWKAREEMLRQ